MRPARSYLYVPADRRELAAKALAGEADAVMLDLEDAVAASRKAAARAAAAELVRDVPPKPVWVRINAPASGLAEADVAAVAGPGLAGVRIPKVESQADVRLVADGLAAAGSSARIQCLLESAAGVERAFEIARADEAVVGLALGEADLAADLGVRGEDGLLFARSRCVVACRAAGLTAPVQSVWTDLGDPDGLRRSTERGRALGFFGRSAIHPAQLPAIHDVFTPTADEVAAARELVERLAEAEDRGAGGLVLPDGRFVDRAVVEAARRTLALAEVGVP